VTTGGGGVRAGALLLVAAVVSLACPARQAVPPSGPPPGSEPEPGWASSSAPASAPASVAMSPVEAGFTHCCGTERYRIEIECGEMLKRCYEKKGGTWKQTYGRHCKEHLSEGCYLQDCDAKCR
jgi:hypothetical protein